MLFRSEHGERDDVWGSGNQPTSDLAGHLALYRARPDIRAIAHAHLPAALALTLAGELPETSALAEAALLLPRLPFVPFGVPGSSELAERVARAMTEPPEPFPTAALLERHGAVAVGNDPRQAVDRLEIVEVLCRTWRDALLLRAARATLGIVPSPSPGG